MHSMCDQPGDNGLYEQFRVAVRMILSRSALRAILVKEEGRRWREQIPELEADGIYVSVAFLSFAGMMMFCSMGVIAFQIIADLLGVGDASARWVKPVLAVPFCGMFLGLAQGVVFRLLYKLRPRKLGWYWWPASVKIIVTLAELGSMLGTALLFAYVM